MLRRDSPSLRSISSSPPRYSFLLMHTGDDPNLFPCTCHFKAVPFNSDAIKIIYAWWAQRIICQLGVDTRPAPLCFSLYIHEFLSLHYANSKIPQIVFHIYLWQHRKSLILASKAAHYVNFNLHHKLTRICLTINTLLCMKVLYGLVNGYCNYSLCFTYCKRSSIPSHVCFRP